MWSMQPTGEAASGSRLPDHRPDYARVNRHIEWRTVPDKHGTALCRRASFVKILAMACPVMAGSGKTSTRWDLPIRTVSVPFFQSMSSRRNAATSKERSPRSTKQRTIA